MTLRENLYISVFLHLLAVGSALAFSRFTGNVLYPYRHAISVSLVSSGVENAMKTGSANRQSITHRTAPPVPVEKPAEQPATSQIDLNPIINQVNEGQGNEGQGTEAEYGKNNEEGSQAADANLRGNSSIDLISTEQWAAIETAISRNKHYPRIARERGVEGTVRLRFRLKPSGAVDKLEVIESSGSDVLDSASVQAVYRAAPMPYVNGWVEIPIAYVLK